MHKLNRTLRVAALALVLALAGGFLAGFYAADAHALPANEVERVYYSDGTYTTIVGERILLCTGGVWQWGTTSGFVRTYTTPCWW